MQPVDQQAPPREPVAVARRIAAQLAERLQAHEASGDAFVVSVYGEWGIGKTRCLTDVFRVFDDQLAARIQALDASTPEEWVVPVLFDPWQYEHEAHLIVPLLKTIEHRLREVHDQVDTRLSELKDVPADARTRAQALGQRLAHAGGVLGDVAVALLSGFKFGFAPLKEIIGLEVNFEPKAAFEAGRAADERRTAARAAAAPPPATSMWARLKGTLARPQGELATWASSRESLYFEVRERLAALTAGEEMPLRFVVLIDDLDRCLPEKAIQVLESVKLFLNAPGFSFVLAVDDEVVERGIAHRYQPYLGASVMAAPISGAEYLEKIVHLPVHLQRWTDGEATSFLRTQYDTLFDASKARRADELLTLVLRAVPLVPRKLIRLAEATLFMLKVFEEQRVPDCWYPLHAARLVALQQLYPSLYRYLRLRPSRYWRLFELVRNDFGEPEFRQDKKSLHGLQQEFDVRKVTPVTADPLVPRAPATGEDVDSLRERLDLLRLVNAAGEQRGNPDPLLLFADADAPQDRDPKAINALLAGYKQFAQLYIHGLRPPEPAPATAPAATAKVAAVADAERLLNALMSSDLVSRREHLQANPLDGRLPDAAFDSLMQRLRGAPDRAADVEWLSDVSTLLSPEQLLAVYREHKVIDRLWSASSRTTS